MTTTLRFTVPGQPVPKQRPRLTRRGKAYTPQKTLDYEFSVATHAVRAAGYSDTWPMTATYRLDVTFYMGDARRSDLDNAIKSLGDGLNGILYDDDHLVTEIHAHKRIDRKNPRAEVTLTVLEPAG